MNNKTCDFNFSSVDVEVICSSLDNFISIPVDEISPSKKHEIKVAANSAKSKLKNKETDFKSLEFQIMYFALLDFKDIINETNSLSTNKKFNDDSEKYLSSIEHSLSVIKLTLEANGIHIS